MSESIVTPIPFLYQAESGLYTLPKPISREAIIQSAKALLAQAVQTSEQLPYQTPLLINYFLTRLADYEREVIVALFLNAGLRLLAYDELSVGAFNQICLHPEILMSRALGYQASAIVLAHNRPNELEARFSLQEIEFTAQLRHVLGFLNIHLLDHILISPNEGCSLKQKEPWVFEDKQKGRQ